MSSGVLQAMIPIVRSRTKLARSAVALAAWAIAASTGCGGAAPPGATSKLPCAAPAHVLAGVYSPDRLHVLAACRAVSGTVREVSHEQDGDLHVGVDTGGALTNAVNRSRLGGRLVIELMPRDGGHLPAPRIGDHLRLTGAWVLDTNHGWYELHPVWSETLAGVTYRSGPQYGGSPADANSSEASAECTSHGARCRGYGGTRSR